MAVSKLNPSAGGIPFGNTAGRPNETIGKLYSNGDLGRLEIYGQQGWQNIIQEVPGVASVTGNYSEATNSGTITISGTNFAPGSIASAIGENGVEIQSQSTTYNSLVQLTAVFTNLSNAQEPYDIKVTNPSNLFGLLPNALYVNASPVWQTASGSFGTFGEELSITLSALSATDSDSTVIYSLANGSSLPSGVTLNSSTGVISGTLPDISTTTTYSFTVNATDGVNVIPRSFSFISTAKVSLEYLVVAGGGGGGRQDLQAGGGGAGGYRSSVTGETSGRNSSVESKIIVGTGSTLSLSIGAGGSVMSRGVDSTLATITSLGGGYGGDEGSSATTGGSGGGGSWGGSGAYNSGAAGTSSQGFAGGSMTGGNFEPASPYSCGGGGGAGGVGADSNKNAATPGSGGIGIQSSITGTPTYYAGGGGGGSRGGGNGAGGNGGGGTGRVSAGSANTGGGGGAGFSGGSGVVIIAYPDSLPAIATIPGTLTYNQPTRSGYRVYRFTAGSGTVTF